MFLTLAGLVVVVWTAYAVCLVAYRLFGSSICQFPGPKLAAATFWYEFYYDVVLGGQYAFRIAEMHKEYGPVVRINPLELHVHDTPRSDDWFYDKLYAGGKRRRHKWSWATRALGADLSTFATVSHETHRLRRSALNPFFSATRVRELAPLIQDRAQAVMQRVRQSADTTVVLSLDVVFGAYAADVIMQYAFGQHDSKVEAPDFDDDFHQACINGGRQLLLTRHFPILLKLMHSIPPRTMLWLNPSMLSFFNMHKDIAIKARECQQRGSVSTSASANVFREILGSKLPKHEKTFPRLATDGGALVGAGTVTTAWGLTNAVFWLLCNPSCLLKLKQELAAATIDLKPGCEDARARLLKLETLPYLTAVTQEALRMSVGVSGRLARVAPDETLVVDGRNIPAGTPVSMSQLLIFTDERYFPDPYTFHPERWVDNSGLDRFQVVFCKGSRICLGKHLALAEMHLMLANLFLSYGSKEVRMDDDAGFLELFETDESDVRCSVDAFVPLAKRGSQGVRCRVVSW